jgi:tetratricopeptide (TPR) repeat protein
MAVAMSIAIAPVTAPAAPADPSPAGLRAMLDAGDYTEAEALARVLLERSEREHGPASLETARALDLLVESFLRQHRGAEPQVRQLAERAVALKEHLLGADTIEHARSLRYLATVLDQAGEDATAQQYLERVLGVFEAAPGLDASEVAWTLNGLSLVLSGQGQYEPAREALQRALSILETTRGPDDPKVAAVAGNLAILLRRMGESKAASDLFDRTLAIEEKALGADHPQVVGNLMQRAGLRADMGRFAEAEADYQRALEIRSARFGPEHSSLIPVLEGLGGVYRGRGELRRAQQVLERAVRARETESPRNPRLFSTLNELALVVDALGDAERAWELYSRSLQIVRDAYGPDHVNASAVMVNMAATAHRRGDYGEMRRLFEQVLALDEKRLGASHPYIAEDLMNLGLALYTLGQHDQAQSLLERALPTARETLGPDHFQTGVLHANLGEILAARGDAERAAAEFAQGLSIMHAALGDQHPSVAEVQRAYGSFLRQQGNLAGAADAFGRALAIHRSVQGESHPSVALVLAELSNVDLARGDLESAHQRLEQALAIQEGRGDEPAMARTLGALARLHRRAARPHEALLAALRAEELRQHHVQLVIEGLSEREALRFVAGQEGTLDLALAALTLGRGSEAAATADVWSAVIGSRALVLDEIAARNRLLTAASDSLQQRKVDELRSARHRLANLVVRGPAGETDPEAHRQLIAQTRGERERLERALAVQSAALGGSAARRASFAEVAAALRPQTTLAAYVRFSDSDSTQRYAAFVLRNADGARAAGMAPALVDLGSAIAIDQAAGAWRAAIREAVGLPDVLFAQEEERCRELGLCLRQLVWDPLELPADARATVLVVPDGALHLVNFTALPADDGGYLIDGRTRVHLLTAERDLLQSGGGDAARRRAPAARGLIAVGGPDFNAQPDGARHGHAGGRVGSRLPGDPVRLRQLHRIALPRAAGRAAGSPRDRVRLERGGAGGRATADGPRGRRGGAEAAGAGAERPSHRDPRLLPGGRLRAGRRCRRTADCGEPAAVVGAGAGRRQSPRDRPGRGRGWHPDRRGDRRTGPVGHRLGGALGVRHRGGRPGERRGRAGTAARVPAGRRTRRRDEPVARRRRDRPPVDDLLLSIRRGQARNARGDVRRRGGVECQSGAARPPAP